MPPAAGRRHRIDNKKRNVLQIVEHIVGEMLGELKNIPMEPIVWDTIANADPELQLIHIELAPDLLQFYNFVSENKMIPFTTKEHFVDQKNHVHGRLDYVDKNLVLFDWTRSTFMEVYLFNERFCSLTFISIFWNKTTANAL